MSEADADARQLANGDAAKIHIELSELLQWPTLPQRGLNRLTSGDVVLLSGDSPQSVSLFCGPGGLRRPSGARAKQAIAIS
jgi:hypothetical protein